MTLVLLALLAGPVDADLQARFRLAAVPGVGFVVPEGERLAPDGLAEPEGWDVSWRSGPDKWTPIRLPDLPGARVLVRSDRGDPLLVVDGRTVVVAFEAPKSLRGWPYFNYVLHRAACEAAGIQAPAFAAWSGSPVPQRTSRIAYIVALPIVWTIFLLLYRRARRLGRERPRAFEEFFIKIDEAARGGPGRKAAANWSRAGFARPLAGYLALVATMSFMIGGYLILQWVLNGKVQPFPQATGLWETPFQTLIIVAILFEMGTNDSAVKYFAEDRVSSPADALADFQFYIWWAFFQRLLQTTFLGSVAIFILPWSKSYAVYSFFVLLFAFKGLPSITPLGRFVCQATQRFDYQNLLDMVESKILRYLAPIPFVLAGRSWGLAHPEYGEIFGAALGLGVGYFVMMITVLALGLWVLRRLGVPLGPLFLAQFRAKLVKRNFLFGGKIAIGAEPIQLVAAIEAVVIIHYFRDFTSWQGIRDLLLVKLFFLYRFAEPYYGGAVPAISEAYSAGKKRLTQYYIARYIQFGFLFHAAIFSLMVALGPVYIGALGGDWGRATPFLVLALAMGLLYPPVLVSDNVLKGTGRPLTLLGLMYVEYGARVALIVLLVPRIGFSGILLAGVLSVALKAVSSWIVNHKTLLPFRLSVHASLLAPLCAGVGNFLLWKGVLVLWAPATEAGTLALMCVAAGLSFLVCFFLNGLAGGYDEAALDELRDAATMTSFARAIARLSAGAARLGARFAPVRARPLDITRAALAEAEEVDGLIDAATPHPDAAKAPGKVA